MPPKNHDPFGWSGPKLKNNPTDTEALQLIIILSIFLLFLIDSYLTKILVRPGPDWPDLFHRLCIVVETALIFIMHTHTMQTKLGSSKLIACLTDLSFRQASRKKFFCLSQYTMNYVVL